MRTTGNKNQSGSIAQFTQIAQLVGGDAFGRVKMSEQEATARIMELLHPVAHSLAGEQPTTHLTVLGQLASGDALPSGKLQYNWTNTCTALATLPVDLMPRRHPQWKDLRRNLAAALLLAYEKVDAPSQKLRTKVLSRWSELNGGQFNPDQNWLF
jgi:hypothetical protein